jgi:hypothetical protein
LLKINVFIVLVDYQTESKIVQDLLRHRYIASLFHLQIKDVTLKDAGWYDCQVNTSPKISNKSYLQVTEFDPLAVQEPTAANIEKQHDSPAQHGQVIPQIQEFLLRGGQMVF